MIRFITSGISTTIQDLGRFGYRKFGVPVSGAMDQFTSDQANKLLDNEPDCAVLEFIVKGPILFFEEDCWIALTGASIIVNLDEKPIPMLKAVFIPAGKELKLGNITDGRYTYMAVKGGIQSEVVMGSRSQFIGITESNRLTKGMILQHKQFTFEPSIANLSKANVNVNVNVKVQKGPDYDSLSSEVQKALFSVEFKVSSIRNRMGIRLLTNVDLFAPEISTSPVMPGIVQLTPSGELIVLGKDAGVSGGYARVLIVENIGCIYQNLNSFRFEFRNLSQGKI